MPRGNKKKPVGMVRENIPLSKIAEPASPSRTDIDDAKMESLCESIEKLGLINPITVKAKDDGTYEVVAGQRRLLALRRLNVAEVDCYVKPDALPDEAVMIHENIEREELNPVDEGDKYLELYEKLGDMEKVVELVKKPLTYVERRVDLVYQKDSEIVEACRKGEISLGVAEELNRMTEGKSRLYHLHFAKRQGATIRQMRDWRVQANLRAERDRAIPPSQPPTGESPPIPTKSPDPVPAFTHHAEPWQLSGELTPRKCIFCGQHHPEHKGFKLFACGVCCDKHMLKVDPESETS